MKALLQLCFPVPIKSIMAVRDVGREKDILQLVTVLLGLAKFRLNSDLKSVCMHVENITKWKALF